MFSNRVISILVLAVFGFTLGLELFSSHDLAVSCGADPQLTFKPEQSSTRNEIHFSDLGSPEEPKEVPCSDPCHQGYCHFGHCFHVTVSSFSQIKATSLLKTYRSTYERSILTQHAPSIFRPPIS